MVSGRHHSRRRRAGALLALISCWAAATLAENGTVAPTALTAGPFTGTDIGPGSLSIPAALLSKADLETFSLGKEKFNEAWVVAPLPGGVWGLGPTFNEDRCAHCHMSNGRARAPQDGGEAERGLLLRISIPGKTREGAPNPHPNYGDQIQNRGIENRVPAEGRVFVHYEETSVELEGGERASLRQPRVELRELAFGPLGDDTAMSLRIAPALVGMGLLEAVPEETLRAREARQGELGLRGKLNIGWDFDSGRPTVGRFGWKASQPNLRQQVAAAFISDIGATTYLFPEENCPVVQTQCRDVPSAAKCGGQGGCTGNDYRPEVQPSRLNGITLYLQGLAVPPRRDPDDPEVHRGEGLFAQLHCDACHLPTLETGSKAGLKQAVHVEIHPYTDLLLHDMGEGLADHRPDYLADGRQWRTPPLWGIGLLPTVSGHSDLLHDGRARYVTEAVLWHGGDAEPMREAFRKLPVEQRKALVRFVESL